MNIPKAGSKVEIDIKNSKFFAETIPADSEEEARSEIKRVRSQYPDATHVVWAYLIGPTADVFGLSDDREPRGTAGRPVLEVLKGSGMTNVLVTVTRYFGGTKLGTGGLVKAYSGSASAAIEKTPVEEYAERLAFTVTISYNQYEKIRQLLESYQAIIENEKFTDTVLLSGYIKKEHADTIKKAIKDKTAGSADISL